MPPSNNYASRVSADPFFSLASSGQRLDFLCTTLSNPQQHRLTRRASATRLSLLQLKRAPALTLHVSMLIMHEHSRACTLCSTQAACAQHTLRRTHNKTVLLHSLLYAYSCRTCVGASVLLLMPHSVPRPCGCLCLLLLLLPHAMPCRA
jgi:hypothetical protein